MKYYRDLLLSEGLEKKKARIIRKLEHGKFLLDTYIIILAANEQNQLEILDSVLLLQKSVKKDDMFVIGITQGYTDALLLIESLAGKIYDETKDADIRSYILKRQNEGEA